MCLPISMCFQSLMCLWDQFTKFCLLMWRACRWFAVRCLRFGPLPLRQDSQIVAQIIPQSCLTPLSSYFRRLFGLVKFLYVNVSDVTNVSRVPFRFNLWHLDWGQAAPPACLQLLTAAVGLCPAALVNLRAFSLTGSGSKIEHPRKVHVIEVSV